MMGTRIDELFYDLNLRADDATKAAKQAKKALDDVAKSGGASEKAIDDLEKSTEKGARGLTSMSREGKGLTDSLKSIAMKAVGVVTAFLGFRAISRRLSEAARGAAQFNQAMGQVATLTDLSGEAFAALTRQVRELQAELPQTEDDLAMGLYQTLSAGVTDTADAMLVLRESAKLAAAGLLETNTAVDAVTTVMNAYGMEARDVTRVTDTFFKTVAEGKLTIPALATSIGQVATTAALAGVSIEEVGASLATMTKLGIDTARAANALNNFFLSIISPQADVVEMARTMGLEWSAAGLAAEGLGGFMRRLQEATGGNVEMLAELNPSITAARAAFVLAGSGAEEFANILDEMTRSQGAAAEAFQKTQGAWLARWEILKGRVRTMMQELVEGWMPRLLDQAERFISLFEGEFPKAIRRLREIGVDETFIQDLIRHHEIRETEEAIRRVEEQLRKLDITPRGLTVDLQMHDLAKGAEKAEKQAAGLQRQLAMVASQLDVLRKKQDAVERGVGPAGVLAAPIRTEISLLERRQRILEDQLKPLEEQIRLYHQTRMALLELEQLEKRREALLTAQVGVAVGAPPAVAELGVAGRPGLSPAAARAIADQAHEVAMAFRHEMIQFWSREKLRVPLELDTTDMEAKAAELRQHIIDIMGGGIDITSPRGMFAVEQEIARLLESNNEELRERGRVLEQLFDRYLDLAKALAELNAATAEYEEAMRVGDEARKLAAVQRLERAIRERAHAF